MVASVVQTVDQACSAVRFTSDLFTTFNNANSGTLTLEYTINCGKLTYVPANTSTNVIEYASTFVSCDTECRIYDEFAKDRSTSSMVLYYDVIKLAVTCDTCECVKACTLFNELNGIITGNETSIDMSKFIKVEDCGCNKSK